MIRAGPDAKETAFVVPQAPEPLIRARFGGCDKIHGKVDGFVRLDGSGERDCVR